MWRAVGTIAVFLLGCILLPVALVIVLLVPRRDGRHWRSMPPLR